MRLVPVVALAAASCGTPTADTPTTTADTPPPTVWQTTNLPPPLTTEATVTTPALRGPQIQVSEPPPAPTTTIPTFANDCAEMAWYRAQAGLPAKFDNIGYRESRCRNEETVHTFCCWGWWQLYVNVHLADHRLAPLYANCGVSSRYDIDSDTVEDKTRQACAAAAVYSISGIGAWTT